MVKKHRKSQYSVISLHIYYHIIPHFAHYISSIFCANSHRTYLLVKWLLIKKLAAQTQFLL